MLVRSCLYLCSSESAYCVFSLLVSAVSDWSGYVLGQSWWQQGLVRYPRYNKSIPLYKVHYVFNIDGDDPHFTLIVVIFVCLCRLGLDYVSHEDILPYNSTEQVPIQHELFERFLLFSPSKSN